METHTNLIVMLPEGLPVSKNRDNVTTNFIHGEQRTKNINYFSLTSHLSKVAEDKIYRVQVANPYKHKRNGEIAMNAFEFNVMLYGDGKKYLHKGTLMYSSFVQHKCMSLLIEGSMSHPEDKGDSMFLLFNIPAGVEAEPNFCYEHILEVLKKSRHIYNFQPRGAVITGGLSSTFRKDNGNSDKVFKALADEVVFPVLEDLHLSDRYVMEVRHESKEASVLSVSDAGDIYISVLYRTIPFSDSDLIETFKFSSQVFR